MASEMAKDMSGNPFEALGAAFAEALVNKMVDAFVTPESLAMMLSGEKPQMEKSKPAIKSVSSTEAKSESQYRLKCFANVSY